MGREKHAPVDSYLAARGLLCPGLAPGEALLAGVWSRQEGSAALFSERCASPPSFLQGPTGTAAALPR